MTPSWSRPWWALTVVVLAAPLALSLPHEGGLVGARKLDQVHDCRGVVAFSGVAARPSIHVTNASQADGDDSKLGTKLGFRDLLTDQSVGWSRETGEFTCICPGLYQFAFSASGVRLSLGRKEAHGSKVTPWKEVVSTGNDGGAHVLLLEMDLGDVVAVWLAKGELPPEEDGNGAQSSFSGYRISKK